MELVERGRSVVTGRDGSGGDRQRDAAGVADVAAFGLDVQLHGVDPPRRDEIEHLLVDNRIVPVVGPDVHGAGVGVLGGRRRGRDAHLPGRLVSGGVGGDEADTGPLGEQEEPKATGLVGRHRLVVSRQRDGAVGETA
jgi:hypothetical protein